MLDFCLLSIIGIGLLGAALAAAGILAEVKKRDAAVHAKMHANAIKGFDDNRSSRA